MALIDQFGDRVLNLRRRVNVYFAAQFDDVRVLLRLANVHFDIQNVSLPYRRLMFVRFGKTFAPVRNSAGERRKHHRERRADQRPR